jgi:hypothetical protein
MDKKYLNNFSQRENFLLSVLNKVIREYKTLLEFTRRHKPLKIIDIIKLSTIPGETIFAVQLTNKNCIVKLNAAEIINNEYNLNDFSDFHSNMIQQAAQGKLIDFLKISEKLPTYTIVEKRSDKALNQHIFTIETKESVRFTRTAEALSNDKNLLLNMNINDIYDIGFIQGCESILKEKSALILAKRSHEK